MRDEAELIRAALELLDQRRREGEASLRDVADAALGGPQSSRGERAVSAAARRRVACELIKSEISRRWEEAAAAAMSQRLPTMSPSDGSIGPTSASLRLLEQLSVGPIISEGMRPKKLEAFLAEWSGELDDFTSVLDLSVHEFCVRRIAGDEPQVAEYEDRFADLAGAIRDRLSAIEDSLDIESSIRGLLRDTDVMFRYRGEYGSAAASDSVDSTEGESLLLDEAENELQLLDKSVERVDFFRDLPPELRLAVVKRLVLAPFAAGDVLLRQGDAAEELLVLLQGTLRVAVEEHGRVHEIARLVRRTVIGEMGLLTQARRTASVIAETAGWAATLSREDFESLAGRHALLNVSLSELIAQRLGTVAVDALCGKQIDRYEIRQRLGRGGMGIVYLATDREEDRPVALKMLPHDRALDLLSSRRFRQEAEIVRNLRHPNIVSVYREFSAFGTTFIAMEWCDGPTLADVIKRSGAQAPESARKLVGQIAAALAHTHAAGIAHRDLKPSNVLLTQAGEAKLADFGLARTLAMGDSDLTAAGEMLGTPRYMAPEQIEGERGDERSDIFSLGCIAYELWTGKPPFTATKWRDMLRERDRWTLPPREEISPTMDKPFYSLLAGSLCAESRDRSADLRDVAGWA